MKNFGEKLKALRQEQNLTQEQLAKKAGVSKAVISFWENDVNEPKASYIKILAQTFDVTTDYLLSDD